jgi:hypothetical protein
MWVRMGVEPATPVAGEPAQVAVKTVYLLGAACLDDPKAEEHPFVASAPARPYQTFDLVAVGPDGAADVRFEVNQSSAEPTTWVGPVTFPTPGEWTLRIARPDFSGAPTRCSGAALDVTVLPNGLTTAWWAKHGRTGALLALIVVFSAGAAIATRQITRRRAPESPRAEGLH